MKGAIAACALVFAAAACGGAPPPAAPVMLAAPAARPAATVDESFREHPPVAVEMPSFEPPVPVATRLPNGVRIFVSSTPSWASAIAVVADGGIADAGPERGELARAMASMVGISTTRLTHVEIMREIHAKFISAPDATVTADAITLHLTGPTAALESMVSLAAGMAFDASFEPKTFDYDLEVEARALEQAARDPGWLAEQAFEDTTFRPHPFGEPRSLDRLRQAKRSDVEPLHARVFAPSRLTVVVSANASVEEIQRLVGQYFGAAKGGPALAAPVPPAPHPSPAPRVIVIDMPGAAGSTIFQGVIGPTAGAGDRMAADMAVDILTGTGHLTRRLRDELGALDWVTPVTEAFRTTGVLGWRMRTPPLSVAPVLRETDRALRQYLQDGPSDEEFVETRNRHALSTARQFVTARGVTTFYAAWLSVGVEVAEAARLGARASATTRPEALEALRHYVDPDHLRTVIAGDWTAMRDSVLALGWGPVEVRDTKLAVVRVEAAKGP